MLIAPRFKNLDFGTGERKLPASSSLQWMRDIAFAIALGKTIAAALVAGLFVGMTWHDEWLVLLIASMTVALRNVPPMARMTVSPFKEGWLESAVEAGDIENL
jgi:hypothetical protein